MKTHHHLSVQRQNFDLLKDIISICCGLVQEYDYLVCRVSEIWRLKLHALLSMYGLQILFGWFEIAGLTSLKQLHGPTT